jgi:hypothetical protein
MDRQIVLSREGAEIMVAACPPPAARLWSRRRRADGLLRGAVIAVGQELAGRGFIGGSYQHANTLKLQRWLLPSGIVCRQDCCQAVTAQHPDDQFRLYATGSERHGHTRNLTGRLMRSPCHRDHLRFSGRIILISSTSDTILTLSPEGVPMQGCRARSSETCGPDGWTGGHSVPFCASCRTVTLLSKMMSWTTAWRPTREVTGARVTGPRRPGRGRGRSAWRRALVPGGGG